VLVLVTRCPTTPVVNERQRFCRLFADVTNTGAGSTGSRGGQQRLTHVDPSAHRSINVRTSHLLRPPPRHRDVDAESAELTRHTDGVAYADDPEEYRQRLEAKLQPHRIRATLSFAGLYQITHEMIKQSVLEEVRLFYRQGFDETGWQYDEEGYKRQVLSRAPKDQFKASLLWLVDSEAITLAQAERLDAIYAHRHELSHELIKYIVDPGFEPSLELFINALVILKAIRRFWSSVEKDVGSCDHLGDVDLDEVVPLSLMILQQCIDAYAAGLDT